MPKCTVCDPDEDVTIVLSDGQSEDNPGEVVSEKSEQTSENNEAYCDKRTRRNTGESLETVGSDLPSNTEGAVEPWEFRVSSKHLTLASPVFKMILQSHNGIESVTLRSTGSLRLPLDRSDHDPKAVIILLNIIHGRHRSVPHEMDFTTMLQISILVDRYLCNEVMGTYPGMWKEEYCLAKAEHVDDTVKHRL